MKRFNRIASVCASIALVTGSLGMIGCGSGDDPVSLITVNSTVYGSDGSTGVANGSVIFNVCIANNGQTLCNNIPGYSNTSFTVDGSGDVPGASVSVPSSSFMNLSIDASSKLTVTTCTATYTDSNSTSCAAKSNATGPNTSSATQSSCVAYPKDNGDGTFTVVVEADFTIADYSLTSQSCSGAAPGSGGSTGSGGGPDAGTGPTALLDIFKAKNDGRAKAYDGRGGKGDDSGSGSGSHSVAAKASA